MSRVVKDEKPPVNLRVTVNRGRGPKEALDATTFWLSPDHRYVNPVVVDAMPSGVGNEVEVVFFKPDLSEYNVCITDDELVQEFERRGLMPADPITVAAVNEADPAFADERPHGTHWKDGGGKWCHILFYRHGDGKRKVVVRGDTSFAWVKSWWFVGVRK